MRLCIAYLFVIILLQFGCAPKGGDHTLYAVMTPQEVRATQAQRTSTFDALVGRGVVEFHWTDDHGKHSDQGDLDFWKQGESISLRISKFGDPLMWFGGEHQSYWMFDMMEDETTLTINGDNSMFSDIDVALVLLGLAPLPSGDMKVHGREVLLTDEIGRSWVARFEPTTHRPLDIQVVDGVHQTKSTHHRGIRVELEGKHELYWPLTGGLMDLEDDRGSTKIKIVFSSLSTMVEDEPMDRVFSLPFLRKALKPTVIIEGESQ